MLGNKTKVLIAEELPMKMEHDLWNPRRKDPGTVRLLSVARIAPEKNTAYALEVLKECWSGLITYDIYGQVYDSGYWEECKKIIAQMPANITVNYLGSLPGDQVLDRMQEYHLMFMPTTGENFGHTILESLMSSTPVLISDRTPWLKLEEMGAGWDIPLGRKDLFAACIGKVVEMGQESYNLLSRNAWLMADRFLKNPSLVSQNINLFEDEK
jgi:glycosyltransferase involved in cell wall biosynthesis